MLRTIRTITAAIVIAGLSAGCATSPTSTPPGATPAPTAVVQASPTPMADASASAQPSSSVVPTAAPSPVSPPSDAVWSPPRTVRGAQCSDLVATIDGAGRYHVAAACEAGDTFGVSYLTSTDGHSWTQTTFDPPADRLERGPQLAVDGDTVYLAYSRLQQLEGGCGDDGLHDLGVYIRSRRLPGGEWSSPARVGDDGDLVQSFRAAGGVLYLAVTAKDGGPMFYESVAGGTLTRVPIPDADGASLRVGDDGHARIAYSTGHAIQYARVDGSALTSETVAATDATFLIGPSLVLGPGDRPYIMWTQTTYPPGGGCAGPDAGPLDGTWFASKVDGHWTKDRITVATGENSFTVDPSTGRIHAIVDVPAMRYYVSDTGTDWTHTQLAGTKEFGNPVIRLDGTTGTLAVVALRGSGGISILSKP